MDPRARAARLGSSVLLAGVALLGTGGPALASVPPAPTSTPGMTPVPALAPVAHAPRRPGAPAALAGAVLVPVAAGVTVHLLTREGRAGR